MQIEWNYAKWTPWTQRSYPFLLTLTLEPSFTPLKSRIGAPLFTSILVFSEGNATWVFREREARAVGDRMIDLLASKDGRARFSTAVDKSVAALKDALRSALRQDLSLLTSSELMYLYETVRDPYYEFYSLAAFIEPIQVAAQALITPALNAALTGNGTTVAVGHEVEPTSIYAALSPTFVNRALVEQAHLARTIVDQAAGNEDLLRAISEAQRTRNWSIATSHAQFAEPTVIGQAISEFLAKWWWIKNSYSRVKPLDANELMSEIFSDLTDSSQAADRLEQDALKMESERLDHLDAKSQLLALLAPFDKDLVEVHDLIGSELLDLRKELVLQVNGVVGLIFERLESSLSVEPGNMMYLLPQELSEYMHNPRAWDERISQRKTVMAVYQADYSVLTEDRETFPIALRPMDGPVVAEGGPGVDALLKELNESLGILVSGRSDSAVRGEVIVRPKDQSRTITRPVACIRNPDIDELPPGHVLLATSTTPDFMRHIRRAVAIVTDWGGQTSHAALTARELGIPCIVGTKYATALFQNGDNITLNFETGEVEISA